MGRMRIADASARVGVLPLDRLGGLVVLIDVVHELAAQICSRGEDAAVDEVALDLGEPELDLVQPRGIGRREVQAHVLVQGQELAHPLGLMRGEVVEDDVNLLMIGVLGHHRAQKSDELFAGVTGCGLTDNLARLGVEGGIEREGSASDVLETVALCPTRRHGQDRIPPVESLNGRLLVQAEYDRVLRRVEVEPNHVSSLGLEVGIVGSHVAFEAMRLEPRPSPYPGHSHVRDTQMAGKLAAAPMSTPVRGRFASRAEDLGFEPVDISRWLATLVSGVQAVQSLGQEANSPRLDESLTAVDSLLDFGVGTTIGEQKDYPRSLAVFQAQSTPPSTTLEFSPFRLGEDNGRACGEHAPV
jgi:hypothetical protein